MNDIPSVSYYRIALARAARRDLTGAAACARAALTLDAQDQAAARLLALCLYEMGEPGGAAYSKEAARALDAQGAAFESVRALMERGKRRRALKALRGLEHQSVRALNAQGCLYAAAGRRRKAAALFAQALARDTGNALAQRALAETGKRRSWR